MNLICVLDTPNRLEHAWHNEFGSTWPRVRGFLTFLSNPQEWPSVWFLSRKWWSLESPPSRLEMAMRIQTVVFFCLVYASLKRYIMLAFQFFGTFSVCLSQVWNRKSKATVVLHFRKIDYFRHPQKKCVENAYTFQFGPYSINLALV